MDVPQDQNFKDWLISEYELVDTKRRYDGYSSWASNPKSHFQGFKSARYVGRGKLLNNKNIMSSFDEEILICI